MAKYKLELFVKARSPKEGADKLFNEIYHEDDLMYIEPSDLVEVKSEVKSGEADQISINWHIEDVKSIAEDLTDDECREVLRMAKHNHDATIGINWDVLEIWADEIRSNREE